MVRIKGIVAFEKNGGMGNNNMLPWNHKKDLKYFRLLTKGNGNNCVVMGKNTFNSIGMALPNRDNIVLSKTLNKSSINNSNVTVVNSWDNVLKTINQSAYDDVWIIGGLSIYTQAIENNLIDEFYVTNIMHEYHCDTFFPINLLEDKYCELSEMQKEDVDEGVKLIYKKYTKNMESRI